MISIKFMSKLFDIKPLDAKLSTNRLHNITHMGIPAEMQIPIALAEFIPGILLLIGVLTRISAVSL